MKRQNNFDFYRKHVVKHIKILVYTCILYYLCINKSNKINHFKTSKVMESLLLFFGIFLSIIFFSLIAKLAFLGISETLKKQSIKN